MRRLFALICFLSGACAVLHAQDQLEVKFRSRALLDVAVSGYGKEDVQGYYRLEDFRVGFKAVYGDFEMKTDRRQACHKRYAAELSLCPRGACARQRI